MQLGQLHYTALNITQKVDITKKYYVGKEQKQKQSHGPSERYLSSPVILSIRSNILQPTTSNVQSFFQFLTLPASASTDQSDSEIQQSAFNEKASCRWSLIISLSLTLS